MLELQKSVDNFSSLLNPSGMLYIDKNEATEEGKYAITKKINTDKGPIDVDWEFENDTKNSVRIWKNRVKTESDSYSFTSQGYLLTAATLERLCENAGLIEFSETAVSGEGIYQPFVAKKPDDSVDTFSYYNKQNAIYRRIWNTNGQICWGQFGDDDTEKLTFEEAGENHIVSLAKSASLNSNSVLLDIGCGNGTTSVSYTHLTLPTNREV